MLIGKIFLTAVKFKQKYFISLLVIVSLTLKIFVTSVKFQNILVSQRYLIQLYNLQTVSYFEVYNYQNVSNSCQIIATVILSKFQRSPMFLFLKFAALWKQLCSLDSFLF